MGPDRRIADYISANRGKFTREAITQQLLDAGYEQGAIDATWAVLDAPDPDDVVGEGFWGRFWIYLIGLNVVAFLLVGVLTQMIPNSTGSLAVLGIVLAIGAAIALGIVALIHPTRLGAETAIAIGGIVPLIFTLPHRRRRATRSSESFGGIAPPPLSGTLTVQIDPPMSLEATGAASCQPSAERRELFNVYTNAPISSSEGPVNVYINASPNDARKASWSRRSASASATLRVVPEPSSTTSRASDPSAGIELEPGSTATAAR